MSVAWLVHVWHIWMSYVLMSRVTHERVILHMNAQIRVYIYTIQRDSFMSVAWLVHAWHIWMRRIWMKESSHRWMNHVTYKCAHTYTHVYNTTGLIYDSFMSVAWLVLVWHVPWRVPWLVHVWRDEFVSYMIESCHVWISHVTHQWVMSHMNQACHIWMSHVNESCEWVMSHISLVWRGEFVRVRRDSCMWYVLRDSFIWVTRLFHMRDKTHSYV